MRTGDVRRETRTVTRLLRRAIGRVRRLQLAKGLAATGVVWLLGVAATMAVDSRIVIFDDRVRWAMTAGAGLLAVATAALTVVRPLCRRIDFRRMAQVLDARHPEHEERLSTLVELSEADANKAGFSASLFSLVCVRAEEDAQKLDVRREFPLTSALRRLAVFLLLALAFVAGIVSSPQVFGRLFVRAVAPWVDIGNVFADDIAVTPGDMVVLSGSIIHIEARQAEDGRRETKDESFSIRISRKTTFGWSDEAPEAMSGGVYETTADLNEREWRYRVTAGPAVTRYHYVRVSERPRYDRFLATVEYPAYTEFRPSVWSNAEVSAIRAIEGSRVRFDLQVPKGTLSDFRIDGEPRFEHVMVTNGVSSWSLELVNRDGFRASMGRHPLTSYEDQPPTLVVEKPSAPLPRLPPYAKIPVEITASDDVRVLRPVVRWTVDGEEMRPLRELGEFAGAGGNLWRGKDELDLSTLNLASARTVRFDFVACDTCPPEFGGPHVVTSSVISVSIASGEWGLEVADLQQQVKEANALIDEARRRLATAEQRTRELRNELQRDGRVSEATEKKNESAAHEIDEARKRLQDLQDRFDSDERFTPLAKPVKKTLAENVRPALEQVESSPFRERDERAEAMEKAAAELHQAAADMDDLSKRLRERAEKVGALEKAKDLSERQDALAKAARELLAERPVDTSKLEAWKRLEEEAMRRVDELARANPDADLSAVRRKMETATREMAKLKNDLDRENAAGKAEESRLKQEESRRTAEAAQQLGELKAAAADQQRAEDALAKTNAPNAAYAQKAAEDHLAKGKALPAVKALQKLARETPEIGLQQAVQQAATAALAKELALREEVGKGEKTFADLKALDEELRREFAERNAEVEKARADAERKAAGIRRQELARQAAGRGAKDDKRKDEAEKARQEHLAEAAEQQKKAEAALRSGRPEEALGAQQAAERKLDQGKATQGVQAMQQLANEAARQAKKAQAEAAKDKEGDARPLQQKQDNALKAQQAAADALAQERTLRQAIADGTKTAADLDALDRGFRKEAEKLSAALTDAVRKRELEAAAAAQRKAADAQQAFAESRAAERKHRLAGDPQAAAERAQAAEEQLKQAETAQKDAEEALSRGPSTEGTQDLQKLAHEAQRAVQKTPRDNELAQAAAAMQQTAAAALAAEQEVRAAMARGEKTGADLEALDREFAEMARERRAAVQAAAATAQQREQRRKDELVRQERELRNALTHEKRAMTTQQGNRTKETTAAQQAAADQLERGEATEAVKALQQQANEAEAAAQRAAEAAAQNGEADASPVRQLKENAVQAQQAAAAALERELAIREGMRKGELTEDDLTAMDRELKAGLRQQAAARTQAATEAAQRAMASARAVPDAAAPAELARLARSALQARRNELSARAAERRLENDDPAADALRAAEDKLDALAAADGEAESRERKVLALQQSALEALERKDWGRAVALQGEIAKAQSRSVEEAMNREDLETSREAANDAQAAACEATRTANRTRNDENQAAAVAAQKAAIEREQAAQADARSARARDELAAAGRETATPAPADPSEPAEHPAETAAEEASAAMDREVNAQAEALGVSPQKNGGRLTSGKGLTEEVQELAKELERNAGADFFKRLFSQFGWFKIRGLNKSGLTDNDLRDVPKEYRDLVRRYFMRLCESEQ